MKLEYCQNQLDPRILATEELNVRFQLHAGERTLPSIMLHNAGLPRPWPAVAETVMSHGDRLKHEVIVGIPVPQLRQWNPFSGQWWFDQTSVATASDSRWVSRNLTTAASAFFAAAHEVTHARVAEIGLLGLLGKLKTSEIDRFHLVSEALAYWVSDIELPYAASADGYFEDFWPAAGCGSHAHTQSPVALLHHLGIKSVNERLVFVKDLYLSPSPPTLVIPSEKGPRLSLFDLLSTERSYVEHIIATVLPVWRRLYWRTPEISQFVLNFVPPYDVAVAGHTVVTHPDEIFDNAYRILIDVQSCDPEREAYRAARLDIQRAALKCAELMRAVRCPHLKMVAPIRRACRDRLTRHWNELLEQFQPFADPNGQASSSELASVEEDISDFVSTLICDLTERSGTSGWVFEHSTHQTMDMSETDRIRSAVIRQASHRAIDGMLRVIQEAVMEYAALAEAAAEPFEQVLDMGSTAFRFRAELRSRSRRDVAMQNARQWLDEQARERTIPRLYPLEWIRTNRHVEPALGFYFE